MESKEQYQSSVSKWSFAEVFGLVTVAVLVCGAMVAYWIFEDELPHVWWGLVLPFGIMAGLLGIAFALRSHYGKGTLLGSRFLLLPAALYFLFLSTTHPHRGSSSIALALISYTIGLVTGIVTGFLTSRVEEKHIVGNKLVWAANRNAKDYVRMLAGIAIGFGVFVSLANLSPDRIGLQFLAGLLLTMALYSLVWTYLYEKRNGIRVIIER